MFELLQNAQATYLTSDNSTIDPQSPLQSFLEFSLVDDTIKSLQECLRYIP